MIIKAFSFEQNSYKNADTKRAVADELSEAGVYFESYSDASALFTDISTALGDADALLIGVDASMYLKFKPVLIKAFGFAPAYSEKIDEAIGSAVTDEKVRKAQALVPNESTELISADGLYSGFFVRSGEQYIVVFPLIDTVVPSILTNSMLPFFKSEGNALSEFEDIISTEKASPKANTIVAKLVKNDLRLAIPATPAARMLKNDIQKCTNFENNVFFTPFVNDDGVSDAKEYAAQLAKGAMDLRSTDIGATVSNIFREKKGDKVVSYYAFISVAVEEKIVVKKLFADADEKVENLITEATSELYALIDKYLDEIISKMNMTDEEREKYEKSLIEAEIKAGARPVASIGKKGTIAIIIFIILAVAACIVLGFKFGNYFVKPDDAEVSQSLQTASGVYTPASEQSVTSTDVLPSGLGDLLTAPSSTSIFDVTATAPTTPVTGNGGGVSVNYDTGDDRPQQQPDTTKPTTAPPTTKPTEAPTQPTTTKPTTQPPTTQPTEAPTAAPTEPTEAPTEPGEALSENPEN